MKVRIKFAKHGAMKFIGHLDIMRYFQKAMRRADIDIAFTEGFNPHMVMSFAQPLGVGLTSNGEYLDIELRTAIPSREGINRLNQTMVEGMEIVSFRQIDEKKASKAMSLVAAADYTISWKQDLDQNIDWQNVISSYLSQETICVLKKSKKSEKEMDIKPFIYECRQVNDGIFMKVSAGSVVNIRPELVMESLAAFAGRKLTPFSYQINREELYGKDEKGSFVSLEDMGKEIV